MFSLQGRYYRCGLMEPREWTVLTCDALPATFNIIQLRLSIGASFSSKALNRLGMRLNYYCDDQQSKLPGFIRANGAYDSDWLLWVRLWFWTGLRCGVQEHVLIPTNRAKLGPLYHHPFVTSLLPPVYHFLVMISHISSFQNLVRSFLYTALRPSWIE